MRAIFLGGGGGMRGVAGVVVGAWLGVACADGLVGGTEKQPQILPPHEVPSLGFPGPIVPAGAFERTGVKRGDPSVQRGLCLPGNPCREDEREACSSGKWQLVRAWTYEVPAGRSTVPVDGLDAERNAYWVECGDTNCELVSASPAGRLRFRSPIGGIAPREWRVTGERVVGLFGGGVEAHSVADGARLWSRTGAFDALVGGDAGPLYAIESGLPAALDPASGEVLWRGEMQASALVADTDGDLYFAADAADDRPALVVSLDAAGSMRWSRELAGEPLGVANGLLFLRGGVVLDAGTGDDRFTLDAAPDEVVDGPAIALRDHDTARVRALDAQGATEWELVTASLGKSANVGVTGIHTVAAGDGRILQRVSTFNFSQTTGFSDLVLVSPEGHRVDSCGGGPVRWDVIADGIWVTAGASFSNALDPERVRYHLVPTDFRSSGGGAARENEAE